MELSYTLKDIKIENLEISADSCQETDITENFNCVLCFKIHQTSKKCIQCEKVLCLNCLQNYTLKYKNCPICKTPLNLINLSRLDLSNFNSLHFKCINEKCKAYVKFENMKEHIKICDFTQREAKCL
jgi:hypothetical protein